MNGMTRPQFAVLSALVALLTATLACSIGPGKASKPAVSIAFPQAGSSFQTGQEVIVQSVATDAKGISRVELWVDGQPVHTQAVAPPATSHAASQPWTPAIVGSHVIEVRAYNVDNSSSDPAQVIVTVAPVLVGGLRVLDSSLQLPFGNFPRLTRVSFHQVGKDLVLWGAPDWSSS